MTLLGRFLTDDRGATAIEYGLIAGLIAVTCIVAFISFGSHAVGLFNYVSDNAIPALSGGPAPADG